MATEPKIRAGAVAGLLEMVAALGADPRALATEVGIDPALLSDPESFLPLSRFVGLFEKAAERVGDPALGLKVGCSSRPEHLGVLGYVLLSSPDVRTAIANLLRYSAAHQEGAEMSLREEEDRALVCYRVLDPGIEPRRQDAELTVGVAVSLLRSTFGSDFAPSEVWFEHGAPHDLAEHRGLLACPIYFGKPVNAVVLERALLERPMSRPDPALLTILRSHADAILSQRESARSFAAEVRAAIAERLKDGAPPIDAIARSLGASASTLKRRLKDEASSFSDELDAARRGLAERYLADRAITLTEVAFLLGYADASAFNRAFKRWTGLTPLAFRRGRS